MISEKTNSEQESGEKVVDTILKQLTPENIQKQIQEIKAIELPQDIQKWVEEYEKVADRDKFLWKWAYKTTQITTISIVPDEFKPIVCEIKTLLVMFDALLDDIADKEQNGQLLTELLKIPFNVESIDSTHLDVKEKAYIELTISLWKKIKNLIKSCPEYEKFKEVFDYDINQLLNAMRYSYLINKNYYLINDTEYWLYLPFNMSTVICYTVDLMCSSFNINDLGKLREIGHEAQKMARVGNWVSTWEREIKEGDITSGVVSYALKYNFIQIEDINNENKSQVIEKIKSSGAEDYLLKQWGNSFFKIKKELELINLTDIAISLEKLIQMHLMSRGYK
ncbi:hypothetical protein KKA72_01190 [Patescibacteria group bacterium]|nr:hypothetical protein [Patescibacteria group bacterium]MBU1876946.1 hypothetical protein [Patescibacteria group bacterium]